MTDASLSVVVVGRTGQLATELRRCTAPGIDIRLLGRPELDLLDPVACARAIRGADADIIINAAAYTGVDMAESEEALAHTINAEAPTAMANAAAEQGIPFLQVSTDYVYDGSGMDPYLPDSPTGPLGAYGRTKLAGDLGVIAAGGPHAILRTSWVFSARGNNFVKTMLRLGKERDKLTIVADQIGGPTPAAAIAGALWEMAMRFHGADSSARVALSGIYHFAGSPDASWADFAREIFRQSGIACEVHDIPTTEYPTPAQRPLNSRLDCTSLTKTFGIQQPDWRAGLTNVLKELSHVPA